MEHAAQAWALGSLRHVRTLNGRGRSGGNHAEKPVEPDEPGERPRNAAVPGRREAADAYGREARGPEDANELVGGVGTRARALHPGGDDLRRRACRKAVAEPQG